EDQRSVERLRRLRKEDEVKRAPIGGEGTASPAVERPASAHQAPPSIAKSHAAREGEGYPGRAVPREAQVPPAKVLPIRKPLRKQLNLSPQGEEMLDEIVEYVRTFSGQSDARVSEVFQAIVTLLFSAKDDLDLSALPKRGAWGSVTAKNFP